MRSILSRWEVRAWGLTGLIVVVSLLIAGVPPASSLAMSLLLMVFGTPMLVLLQRYWRGRRADPLANLAISFGATTVLLGLAFFVLPQFLPLYSIWFIGFSFCLLVGFRVLRWQCRGMRTEPGHAPHSWWGGVAVAVVPAALLLRWTYPVSDSGQTWLPDDNPLFAEWGRLMSEGRGISGLIDGFELRYHWLSYAFLGGLDRLVSTSFLTGPVLVAPVIAWVGLGLGAVAVVRRLTKSVAPLFIAPLSVVFAGTIGVLPYSMGGLGGIVVSPSNLLSAVWLITAILTGLQLNSHSASTSARWGLLTPMGFALMLGKVSTVPAAVVSLLPSAIQSSHAQKNKPWLRVAFSGLWSLVPLVVGGAVAFFGFIWGVGGEFSIDSKLIWPQGAALSTYFLQLMPLGASLFASLPFILPSAAMLFTRRRHNSLVQGSALVGLVGLLVVGVVELRDGNEAWLLLGALAFILPVSSVFVTDTLTPRLAKNGQSVWFSIFCITGLSLATLVVLAARESNFFLMRPWLLPTVVTLILLTFALFALVRSVNLGNTPLSSMRRYKSAVAVAVSLLFLLSITVGAALRLSAFNTALAASSTAANVRSEWIAAARAVGATLPSAAFTGSIAVYSTTDTEQTLARWIPEILEMKNYFIRNDDLVHRVYQPQGSSTMESRESVVRDFVSTGSASACEQLRQDGVSLVWITPGMNDLNRTRATDFDHRWLLVDCQEEK